MKKLVSLILAASLILSMATGVIASDVSSAKYQTTITISNNGTAITDGIAVFDLSTSDMVTGGLLASSADDCAMLTGTGGSDLKFMPAANSTNPWVTWVNSIGANSQISEYLYHKDATGGEIRYFPGAAGMATVDSGTLELVDNFTVNISGFFTTSFSDNYTDRNILYKQDAFRVYVSSSENITSAISFIDKTPTVASSGAWANPSNTIDSNTTTYAQQTVNGIWTDYLVFNTGITTPMTAIEYWYTSQDGVFVDNFESDAYYGGAWHNVHTGVENEGVWITDTLASPQIVSQYRLRWHTSVNIYIRCHEVRADYSPLTVSATGVSSGEHDIEVIANDPLLGIGIDLVTATLPITEGLAFNAPLWYTELSSSPFTSIDTNEYSCTVTGAVWSSTNGYTFDGNDKITLPARWEVAAMTMEAWVYPTGATEIFLGTGANSNYSSPSNWGSIGINANGYAELQMGYIAAAYRTITGAVDLRNGWHHIVGTGNATGSALIVDGVEVATSAFKPNQGVAFDRNGAIGYLNRNGESSNFYNGIVGEARIYTQRFTTGEALTNYNATKWKYDGSSEYFHYNLLGSGVPDTADNWAFLQNNVMPYMESHTITIGGTLQQSIEWEYGATFTDLSGKGHDATPSFRVSSSDADLTAEAGLLTSLVTTSAPTSNVTGGWNMITDTPATPENLFTEGGFDFPGGAEVKAAAEDAGQNVETWLFVVAYGLALIAFIGVYAATHSTQMGRRGSLLLAGIVSMAVLIYFYRTETIPGWTLIPWGLLITLLVMWRKSPSPVD